MATKSRSSAGKSNGDIEERSADPGVESAKRHLEIWSGVERRGVDHTDLGSALRASELRYRRLFETAKDGILILDGDTGIVIDVNPFLVDLLGYTRGEIVGKAFWEFGPFRDTAASKSKFRQLHHVEYLKYDNLPLETKTNEVKSVEFVTNLYLVNAKRITASATSAKSPIAGAWRMKSGESMTKWRRS